MPAGVPLSALLAEPDEPVRYLIDQLWPVGGRVLLAAGAKSGKSTLVSNVVRTLVDGGRFLMRFDTVRRYLGTVAVIDTEMPRDMIRRWYRDQKIDNPTGMVVYPLRGSAVAFDVQDGPRRAEWAARLRGHGTRVLIVDCLNPVLSACNVDESSNAEVGPWLEAFARLLDEAGIGEALITHHMGHGTERSRGASKLLDWPDAVWSLVRPHEGDGMEGEAGPARYLSAIGRDVALAESLLTFDSVSRRLQLAGGNRHQARLTRAVPAVVDHVRSHSGCSVRELQNEITGDLARTDVRAAIKYAIKRGEICVHTQARGRMNHYVRSECAECA
jgi:hypothetical protein